MAAGEYPAAVAVTAGGGAVIADNDNGHGLCDNNEDCSAARQGRV